MLNTYSDDCILEVYLCSCLLKEDTRFINTTVLDFLDFISS